MKHVGAHVSTEGGVSKAPLNAKEIGAKAFAFFTKNQKRWLGKDYTVDDISGFKKNLKQSGISSQHILAHASYLINIGNPDPVKRKIAVGALIDEVKRCRELGVSKLVFHPGSTKQLITEEECLQYISFGINEVIAKTQDVILLIENTAGQGGNLGYKFEHLAALVDKTEDKNRIGVCIDTCHLFAAGYDFRTKEQYEDLWENFAKILGLRYLKGLHLNDCKTDFGSRKDRHASIGKGNIGLKPFAFIMRDKRLEELPLILETIDPSIWEAEIKMLYDLVLDKI